MEITKIKKIKVSEQIFKQIMDLVRNGVWHAGTKIPSEEKLSELFGVSRVSVRAALQKLQTLGILVSRQGEGTFIGEVNLSTYLDNLFPMLVLSKENIKSLLEFREIIEVRSASLAALRRDEKDLENIKSTIEKMKEDKGNLSKFAKDDLNFHFEVAKATKNIIIIKVNEIMKSVLREYMEKIVSIRGTEAGLKYHPKIYSAIKLGNPENAAMLMREHIMSASKDIERK